MQEQIETFAKFKQEGLTHQDNNRYEEAIISFEQALQTSLQIFNDELSPEHAEIYYLYGNALFTNIEVNKKDILFSEAMPQGVAFELDEQTMQEIAQEQGKEVKDVFIDVTQDEEEEEEKKESEMDQINQQNPIEAQSCEQNKQVASQDKQVIELNNCDQVDKGEIVSEHKSGEIGSPNEQQFPQEEQKEEEEGEKGNQHSEEGQAKLEEGDFQVAWEFLEMAKTCLKYSITDQSTLQLLCKIHQRSGDLECYREHFQSAIEEYIQVVHISNSLYNEPSKNVASLHYSIGQCFIHLQQFESAYEEYNYAIQILRVIQEQESDQKQKEDLEGILAELIVEQSELENQQQQVAQAKNEMSNIYQQNFSPFDKTTVDPNDPNVKVKDLGLIKKNQEKEQPPKNSQKNLKRTVEECYDLDQKSSYYTAKEDTYLQIPSSQSKKRKTNEMQQEEGIVEVPYKNE